MYMKIKPASSGNNYLDETRSCVHCNLIFSTELVKFLSLIFMLLQSDAVWEFKIFE